MFGIVNHFTAVLLEQGDAVTDHAQVLNACIIHDLFHVQRPALADDRHGRGLAVDQGAQIGIVGRAGSRLARRAEGGDPGMLEIFLAHQFVKALVAYVGPWPAALDIVHAQVIELFGNAQLFFCREIDILTLGAVAQRRVVNQDGMHDRYPRRSVRPVRRRTGRAGYLFAARFSGRRLRTARPACHISESPMRFSSASSFSR